MIEEVTSNEPAEQSDKDTVTLSKHRIVIEMGAGGEFTFAMFGQLPVIPTLGMLHVVQDALMSIQRQHMGQEMLKKQQNGIVLPNGVPPNLRQF